MVHEWNYFTLFEINEMSDLRLNHSKVVLGEYPKYRRFGKSNTKEVKFNANWPTLYVNSSWIMVQVVDYLTEIWSKSTFHSTM